MVSVISFSCFKKNQKNVPCSEIPPEGIQNNDNDKITNKTKIKRGARSVLHDLNEGEQRSSVVPFDSFDHRCRQC